MEKYKEESIVIYINKSSKKNQQNAIYVPCLDLGSNKVIYETTGHIYNGLSFSWYYRIIMCYVCINIGQVRVGLWLHF